jgi:hypothetical protein
MTIEMILRALQALKDGPGNPDDPLQARVLWLFNEAADGLTAPELVEAMLGRELTVEEENLVLLQTEPAEGRG